ncbi:MAG: polysaccharide pyruvyl transferase family protein [Bacteroidota bacterium]|nr:polysaccharide pyruvyl transferase family protein [Bacteroidota bacterium]
MLLRYYREPNFGDALNPLIFEHFLPHFFDDDPSIEFCGIGSIIGLEINPRANKKVIFSSGFAYGTLPTIDDSFDFVCVRGPLTAELLKLPPGKAITDGAALLRRMDFGAHPKKYKFSFMPHWESELKYPSWKAICEEADILYLSPTTPILEVIDKILESEVVIAEAMHGAIAADALRTPWIPVKAYNGINAFKWNDWLNTLGLDYKPNPIRSMYGYNDFVVGLVDKKRPGLPAFLRNASLRSYVFGQESFLRSTAVKQLQALKKLEPTLSKEGILDSKVDQLLEALEQVRVRYSDKAAPRP